MNRNVPTGIVPYRMTSSQSMYLQPSTSSVLVRRQMPTATDIASRSTLYRQHPAVPAYSAPTVRASFGGVMKRTSRSLPYKLSSRSCETTALAVRDYQHGIVSRPRVLTPVVRREPERTHSSVGQAQDISSTAIGRDKYPYTASSDVSKKEDMLYMTVGDASRKQKSGYSTPSNIRTEKPAYLAPSDVIKRDKPVYFAQSDTSKREKPAYFGQRDTSKREKPVYFAQSDTSKREKPAYFGQSDTSKREKPAYFDPSDAVEREKPAYLTPSDATRREKSAYLSQNDNSKKDTMTYMTPGNLSRKEKTYLPPRDTSRREKTYPSETSRKPKTFMAIRNDTPQKKTPVILGSKVQYKGTKMLKDLYVIDSRSQSQTSGDKKTNISVVRKVEKQDTPASSNIDVPHFLLYNGKSQWSAFHMKFQIYARRQRWKESELLDRLCFCLTDAASEYFASCLERNPAIAYKDLIEKFKNEFDKNVKKAKSKKKTKPPKVNAKKRLGLYREEQRGKQQASQRYVQLGASQHGKGKRPNLKTSTSEPVDHSRFEHRSHLSSARGDDSHYQRKLTSSSRTHSSGSQYIDSRPRIWKDQTGLVDDIHPLAARSRDDIHSDIGRSRDDIHQVTGRSHNDIHPDIGRSHDDIHPVTRRSCDDIHPDVGRSRDDIHPDVGRSRDDIHPDIGRSRDDIHPDVGRSRNVMHPVTGRSRNDMHPDIGRSHDDIHPPVTRRSCDDIHPGVGRSRDDIHPDVGRSRDDIHQDIGRSRDDIHPDVGRSRNVMHPVTGRSHNDIYADIGRSRDDVHNSVRSGYYRSSSADMKIPRSTEQMSYRMNDDPTVWKGREEPNSSFYNKRSGPSYGAQPERSSEERNVTRLQQDRKRSSSPRSYTGYHSSHLVSAHRHSEESGRSYEKKASQGIGHDRDEPLYAMQHTFWSPEARESDDHLGRRLGSMDRESRRTVGQYNERINTTISSDERRSHSVRRFFDRTEDQTQREYRRQDHGILQRDPLSHEAFRSYNGASCSRAPVRSSHTASTSSELWKRTGRERSARRLNRHQLLNKSRAHRGGMSNASVGAKAARSTGPRHTGKKFTVSVNRAKRVANKYVSLDTARRERDNLKRVMHGQTRSRLDQEGIAMQPKASSWRYSSIPKRKYSNASERRLDVSSSDRQTHYTACADPPPNIVVTLTKKEPDVRRGLTHYHSTTHKKKFNRKPRPSVAPNQSVELLDKKEGKTCIVEGCETRVGNLRIHVMLNHFPQCFHDDYMSSRLQQVVSCLHWLCERLLGKDKELINLMNYVNEMDLLEMNYGLKLADCEQVVLMCEHLSVANLSYFTLKPMNSIALLCNWRVVGALISLLGEKEKLHFRSMLNVLPSANAQTVGTSATGRSAATKHGRTEVERNPVCKAPRKRTASAMSHKTDTNTGSKHSRRIERTRSKLNRWRGAHTTQIQSSSDERKRQHVSSETNWQPSSSSTEQSLGNKKTYNDRKRRMANKSAMTTPWSAKKKRGNPKPSLAKSKHSPHPNHHEHSRKIRKDVWEGIDLSEFRVIDDADEDTTQCREHAPRMKKSSYKKDAVPTKSKEKACKRETQSTQAQKSVKRADGPKTSRQQELQSPEECLKDLNEDSFVVLDEEVEDEDSSPAVEDSSFVVVDDVTPDFMDMSQFSVVDEDVPSPDFPEFSVVDEA